MTAIRRSRPDCTHLCQLHATPPPAYPAPRAIATQGPFNLHHNDGFCPIRVGGIPAHLLSTLPNPDTFSPDLSDNNKDGTVQAYLYWHNLASFNKPPIDLMFRHFNEFLEREIRLLHQEDDELQIWHNRVLGPSDHDRRCTLLWVCRQLTPTTFPNDSLTTDDLTDAERTQFDFLLNWAYAVWTARVSHYHERWKWARIQKVLTNWLDYNYSQESPRTAVFPPW